MSARIYPKSAPGIRGGDLLVPSRHEEGPTRPLAVQHDEAPVVLLDHSVHFGERSCMRVVGLTHDEHCAIAQPTEEAHGGFHAVVVKVGEGLVEDEELNAACALGGELAVR